MTVYAIIQILPTYLKIWHLQKCFINFILNDFPQQNKQRFTIWKASSSRHFWKMKNEKGGFVSIKPEDPYVSL